MARIIWTEPALSDLNEIAEYIAIDKRDAARRLVKQVFTSVDRLEQFPESGRIPPELERSKYRWPMPGLLSCRSRQSLYTLCHAR
ncbi:MAG: type II toxin-antitoxin system RelE/ParE family toxin [Methylobacter sp.]|nr:type II toxin-antitoxin system RelE/ParE family toxin [Methylobacter sp.]